MDSDLPARPGRSTAATLYDVAREAGVSTATVSRVVHAQDRVRPATRRRVLTVIEALGYVPDGAAQSLARQRKEVVGLFAIESRTRGTDIENTGLLFIEQVLHGVESVLSEMGWSPLISFLRDADPAAAYDRMQKIAAKVDGMLIAEDIVGPEQLASLAARTPIGLIAGSPGHARVDVVAADNRAGTKAAVRHIIERHRCTRLCYVSGPQEAADARERRSAFDEALAEFPGATLTGSFEGRFSAFSGQLAVRELLTRPRRDLPDAIVCANDQMALGAIRELQTAGLGIPADVAVVGFDDMMMSGLLAPPLTTVRQPVRLLGERACTRLLERIADRALPSRCERLPTELVIRESCGCHADASPAA
jgi:LacI family transcriptional regulator